MGPPPWVALLGSGTVGLALGLFGPRILKHFLKSRKIQLLSFGNDQDSESEELQRNPYWKPPENQSPPFPLQPIISFDPSVEEASVLYPLIISAVVPRPIAFISTISKTGVGNLSPYSYFNAVSHSPPVLAMGHCWSKGKPKDSLQNILDTGEMVVSIISEWFVESANHTCGPYDPSVYELELAGLTTVPSEKVRPPRISESAVNFEAKLLQHYDLKDKNGNVTCTVVLAEVVLIHVAQAVTGKTPNSGKTIVDPEKLRPVCRLGGNTYGARPHLFDIERPDAHGLYKGAAGFVASERDRMLGRN